MRWVGLTLVLVLGCTGTVDVEHDPAAPSDPAVEHGPRAGTRIRPIVETAAGTKRIVGWHDALLDVDCGFQDASGTTRCYPAAADGDLDDPKFTDAACAAPAVRVATEYRVPKYALPPLRDADGCFEAEWHELGAPVALVYHRPYGDKCQPFVPKPDEPYSYYGLGAPVPVSTFVAAVREHDATGQLWFLAEDGTRAPYGGWDGRPVAPSPIVGGELRWAPWIVAFAATAGVQGEGEFADAACTKQVAYDLNPKCFQFDAEALHPTATTGCGVKIWGHEFALPGPLLTTVYRGENGQCSQATPELLGSGSWFAPGADLTASLKPVGERLDGTGSIRVHHMTMGETSILWATTYEYDWSCTDCTGWPRPDPFVDAASGVDCEAATGADGKQRCLPSRVAWLEGWFADGACTQPLVATSPLCAEPKFAANKGHIFAVDGPHAGSVFSRVGAESCHPAVDPGKPLWRVGAELPPERFAEVTTAIE